MSLITTLLEWGIKAYWPKYAADAEKALRIYQKLGALDGGKLFERAGAVFKSEGLDISQILADGLDLRHIEDIQSALNELVLKPAGNGTLICDGVFDFSPKGAFRQAVMEFQRKSGLTIDGWPGDATISAMRKALKAAGTSVREGA